MHIPIGDLEISSGNRHRYNGPVSGYAADTDHVTWASRFQAVTIDKLSRNNRLILMIKFISKLSLMLLATTVVAVEPAAAPLASWSDWAATAKAPTYAKARADQPLYEDKALWPLLEKNAAYVIETWPKARLLVWANPGVDGPWAEATSWLEGGKPASAVPDANTDVLLPAADQPYVIKNEVGFIVCRHVTLEKGARFQGGDSHELRYFGNCWVKIGANLNINVAKPVGPKHVFCRNDHRMARNPIGHPSGNSTENGIEGNVDGHYIFVGKDKDGSVEYLGVHHAADKIFLQGGTTIVGPDSCLMSGGWNRPVIEPAATMVLMSGAFTGQRDFNDGRFCEDSLRVEGALQAGTIERPLTRDAVVSLNYKDSATYTKARGMIVTPSGSLSVHSKDPQLARLVFRWSGVDEQIDRASLMINGGADVSRRISVSILGRAEFDGVLFMDVDRGGIQLADVTAKAAWKHVVFGANCGAAPEALYAAAVARTVAKKPAKSSAAPVEAKPTAGKPLYEGQLWEPTRQLIWAKPGQDGDPEVAANWLENGKPATVALDRTCDLLLPQSAAPYRIGNDKTYNISCRHLTVGKNVIVQTHQFIAFGNVWVQEGGSLRTRAGGMLKGIGHTFVRNDNAPATTAEAPGLVIHDLSIRKGYVGDGSTVELLGHIRVGGSLQYYDPSANNCMAQIGCAALVIGPDAHVEFGRSGAGKEGMMGVIQLMSGSVLQRNSNAFPDDWIDLVTADWHPITIMAGTPERPLTKDAVLGVSAVEDDSKLSLGLLLRPGNKLQVYSADPDKARLVIRWHGHGSDALTKLGGKPQIRVALFGDCQLDGVLFDNLAPGGLILSEAALPAAWKHISFGPTCAGTGKELISAGKVPPKS